MVHFIWKDHQLGKNDRSVNLDNFEYEQRRYLNELMPTLPEKKNNARRK